MEILSIFIRSSIDKEIIDSLPKLKLIATRSTGYDHIDIWYAKEKGIIVCNVPEYSTQSVAEWTIALMLNLMRKTYYAIDQIKETQNFDISDLRGEELLDKTLRVIGTGRIGKRVITLAEAFGMNVIAYDIHKDEEFAKKHDVSYVTLEDLLRNSDVISIHVSLNPGTYYLINRQNIKLIKRGAYLIDTARGGVVETTALICALKEGILKGVALDVLEEETKTAHKMELLINDSGINHTNSKILKTVLANHILMSMPNVLITPHNAFNSKEAVERSLRVTIENIRSFLKVQAISAIDV